MCQCSTFVNNLPLIVQDKENVHHSVGTLRASFGRKGRWGGIKGDICLPLYQNLPSPQLEIYKHYARCGNKNSDAAPQTFQPSTFASS